MEPPPPDRTRWIVERMRPGDAPRFFRLHHESHGMGWCACVAWWVASFEGWGERKGEENRAVRDALFERGVRDGFFLVDADAPEHPLAWAQVAPRDALGRLARVFQRPADPGAWAVGCVAIPPAARRQGRARRLLRGILEALPALGATSLEAYPREAIASDDAREVEALAWNGPAALYRELGFREVARVPPRLVLAHSLAGESKGGPG